MKKIHCLILVVFSFISYFASTNVFGEENKGKLGIGLNYPGFSVRYCTSKNVFWEAKAQFDTNITVIGGRLSKYFNAEKSKLKFIKGVELDLLSFKGEVSEGNGLAGEVFVGGEYFITKKLSVQLDLGPAFIFVTDRNYSSASASSLEFVANFGINLYF